MLLPCNAASSENKNVSALIVLKTKPSYESIAGSSHLTFITMYGKVFQRIFSLAEYTLPICPEPVWQKMVQSLLNSTTQPVEIEQEGAFQPRTDHG